MLVSMKKCTEPAQYLVPTVGSPKDHLLCAEHARATGRRMIPLGAQQRRYTCGTPVEKISGY
jgi:hypothetical protein